ncbi:MAG: glycosyltransferase family 2 protein [Gemmatimonadales bacterium]|jgi:GT2 family glycosyltransferase
METTTVAIVVNRDKRDYLDRCLRHLARLEPPCARTIVVDDASSDDSVEMVRRRHPDVDVVALENRTGPAAARNAGIRRAGAGPPFAYYLFLDNDAFVEPGTLGALRAAAEADPDVGLVVPKAYQSLAERRLHLAGELRIDFGRALVTPVGAGEIDQGQHDERRELVACSGFAVLARRTVLDEVGEFDEAFFPPAWEDVDLALRVRRAGYTIVYEPAAVVEHVGGVLGRGPIDERESAKVSNWLRLMRKHATAGERLAFALRLPVRVAGRIVTGLREDPRRLGSWVRGVFDRHSADEGPAR